MWLRLLIGTTLSFAALAMVTVAGIEPARQTALVRFMKPTIIAGTAVLGQVLFEHDDERMTRGEPCTTVYAYDGHTQWRRNVLVDFMCVPQERDLATKFAATCTRSTPFGPERLVEYQFAGDWEGHGVPLRPNRAHH
jgi:hypothetical protein